MGQRARVEGRKIGSKYNNPGGDDILEEVVTVDREIGYICKILGDIIK